MGIGAAQAQQPRTEKTISLTIAGELAAAVAECQAKGDAVTATVVDHAGPVKAVHRADGAGKPRASARGFRYGKPSRTGRRQLNRALVALPVHPRRPGRDHFAYPSKRMGGPHIPSLASLPGCPPPTSDLQPLWGIRSLRSAGSGRAESLPEWRRHPGPSSRGCGPILRIGWQERRRAGLAVAVSPLWGPPLSRCARVSP